MMDPKVCRYFSDDESDEDISWEEHNEYSDNEDHRVLKISEEDGSDTNNDDTEEDQSENSWDGDCRSFWMQAERIAPASAEELVELEAEGEIEEIYFLQATLRRLLNIEDDRSEKNHPKTYYLLKQLDFQTKLPTKSRKASDRP